LAIKSVHNEKELLTEVSKGNEKAFASLFYAYHNQLGEYIVLLTASTEMAEEIVQDVFVKIWQNRESITEVEKFTSYLFILTRNYTLNCIRKKAGERKKKEGYTLHIADDAEEAVPDEPLLSPDYQQVIDRAVAQLPPRQHQVFILKQEGRKNADIAKELGISADSVKKYQQWAVKSIRDFVKSHKELITLLIAMGLLSK
jgi:RNA polymerase sigma-70 factor (ECF subfamily)